MNESATAILDFWFGELDADGFCVEDRNDLWFRSNAETDRTLRERFGTRVEQALAGELDDWAVQPQGRLALILLLDQFTRNIYRGSTAAFSGDPKAMQLTRDGLDEIRQLAPIQRVFFYMPFEHSEDIADQTRCVELLRELRNELPEALQARIDSFIDFAIQHRDIIARFRRFPHRNRALGRMSTTEELEYLEDGKRFGQ